ncbi:MAG: hypothetical protein SPI65_03025 [Peptoniphilus sp.]|nr:hypothetical protein [Peptoniphilus sp.]MDD7362770.1 hypothetical protein [Bacillota bacterium]MDY6044534.1 hypothetical protein [Peptoniphilus sp.]
MNEKMMKYVGRAALVCTCLSIIAFISIVALRVSYPSPAFEFLLIAGMITLILAVVLYAVQWVLSIYRAFKRGDISTGIVILICGVIIIGYAVWHSIK